MTDPSTAAYFAMQMVSYAEARNGLVGLMDSAVRFGESISITRDGLAEVVLISAGEYVSMEEALHLFSTSANTGRLLCGLAVFEVGKLLPGDLCD